MMTSLEKRLSVPLESVYKKISGILDTVYVYQQLIKVPEGNTCTFYITIGD